jgi:hypothetical protein
MAANLQMDMGEMIAFLKSGRTPDGGTSLFPYVWIRNVAVLFVCIGALAAWHRFYYAPRQEAIAALQEEYAAYAEKAQAMPELEANIARMKKSVTDRKAGHLAALNRFYDNGTIDKAYETVSDVARKTDMTVTSIKAGDLGKAKSGISFLPEGAATRTSVMPIPIQIRLKGSYPDYLAFLTDMRKAEQVYAVRSEEVGLTADERFFGYVEAEVTLVAYAMEKNELLAKLEGK